MCKKTARILFAVLMFIVVGIVVQPKPMVCAAKLNMKFTHTKGKNKSDVKAVKKIIRKNLQKNYFSDVYLDSSNSIYQYTDLNSSKYRWNAKGRLVSFEARAVLKGNVSFSKLKKLKYLSIEESTEEERKGQIKSMDIKGCISLEYLDCHGNKLTKLDLSHNKALQTLNCSRNQIQKLNLSKNKSLKKLICWKNIIKKLDVSKCRHLEELYCSTNRIQKLNLSNCAALVTLYCSENGLQSLKLPNEAALKELDC